MDEILTKELLADAKGRIDKLRGYLSIDEKRESIATLEETTLASGFWDDNQTAQRILKQIKELKSITVPWELVQSECSDLAELFEMLTEEGDNDGIADLSSSFSEVSKQVDRLEFLRKLSGEDDRCDAILTVHAGAGGTESCDWADMLYRMYTRWVERSGMQYTILDYTPGEEAGLKSASIEITGEYAYGHIKAEIGVHRLVRISPFDSQARRHTSFASVYSYPVFEEVADFEIDEKDLRIDTYRAGGAGGQHVNKTDSAVRMTHVPTNIVVQCQNERSQMQNRETAIKMLKARVRQFYKEEEEKKRADKLADKKKIEWGSQIRSYVLHPYNMVKDHRTDTETSNTQGVLDGDIDAFIEKYLLQYQ